MHVIQENLSRRDTNRLGMSDYFIAPIQRIPRYCLMIKGKWDERWYSGYIQRFNKDSIRFAKVCPSIRHKLSRTRFGFEDTDRLSGGHGLCTKQSATTISFIYWNNLKTTSLIIAFYLYHIISFWINWIRHSHHQESNATLQCVCFVFESMYHAYRLCNFVLYYRNVGTFGSEQQSNLP